MTDLSIFEEKTGVKVDGHIGTWYSISKRDYNGETLYLMEHEEYGDMTACVIIKGDDTLVAQDVWNGFDDYDEWLEEGIDPLMED